MSAPCTVLSGGIGGAKLALGFQRLLPGNELSIIANVGDDFDHLGLRICPDLDTLMYTLGGVVNPETGWGRAGETWSFLNAVREFGGPDWFQLGDRDLATHVMRTVALAGGQTLTALTGLLCERFGIDARLLPVTNDRVETRVHTANAELPFQEYFVRLRAEPAVTRIEYAGAESAKPTPEVHATLIPRNLAAIVIAPSNPYLSIDPILAVPGLRELLTGAAAPVIAVSPIVAGRAVKGPTAKIMRELGLPATAGAIAEHYQNLVDGFILDQTDGALADDIIARGIPVHVCNTIMTELDDKIRLAEECLAFATQLRREVP